MTMWQDAGVVAGDTNYLETAEDDPRWSRVAEAVVRRRTELGKTQREAGDAAGVGRSFVISLENCQQSRYRTLNISKYERYLGWPTGSIAALLLDGEDPEVAPAGPVDVQQMAPEIQRLRDKQVEIITRLNSLETQMEALLKSLRGIPKPR